MLPCCGALSGENDMKLIMCLDPKNGLSFNGRRQSRDRCVIEDIIKRAKGGRILASLKSEKYLKDWKGIEFSDTFLTDAGRDDICFAEIDPPCLDLADEIIIYRWKEEYPRDRVMDIPFEELGFYTFAKNDIKGFSHPKITREVYKKRKAKAKVYFSKSISAEGVLALYEAVGRELEGRVAVKLHSGEKGNQNFLGPEMWKPVIERVSGTVVECNTAYAGERDTAEKHLRLMHDHGWDLHFPVEIMDAEGPDAVLEIPNGRYIKKNYVGKGLLNYDSLLVLSHFKGHPMGGYGGALKQLSIGIASAYGKAYIHGAGEVEKIWTQEREKFLVSMADAALSVAKLFEGRAVYINVMKNMSVDCDCCAVAEDPCMKDIGILASTDPVALDVACLDLVYASDDPGRDHLVERIESRKGRLTPIAAEEAGVGVSDYELIEI